MDKEQLISEVFQRSPIWDQRHKSHHNRYVLDKCWAEVATKCGVTAAAAQKTWKVLRQQFKTHFNKLPPPKSGESPPEDDVEWPFFKSLLFLRDIFEKRPASGNLPEVEQEAEDGDEEDDTQDDGDDLSPPPAASSLTSSAGHFCASTSTTQSSSKEATRIEKIDNLGYRKRLAQIEIIGKGLLDIEKEKLQMKKARRLPGVDKDDEGVAFFTYLLPHVKKLAPLAKLQFRQQVQQLLIESVYGFTSPSNPLASYLTSSLTPTQTQQTIHEEGSYYTVL